jgi:hypothetical protein
LVLAFGLLLVWVKARKDQVDRAIRRKNIWWDPLYEGDKDRENK